VLVNFTKLMLLITLI